MTTRSITVSRCQLHDLVHKKRPTLLPVFELPDGTFEIVGARAEFTAELCTLAAERMHRTSIVDGYIGEVVSTIWLTKEEMRTVQDVLKQHGVGWHHVSGWHSPHEVTNGLCQA